MWGASLAEPAEQIPPAFRVGGREGGNAGERRLQRAADAEIRPVAKDGRESMLRRNEGEAVRHERILVGGEKTRAREHRKVHRAEIVPEAGKRQLARLDRAAGLVLRFDDGDALSPGRQMHARRQAIMAGADDDRVIGHSDFRAPFHAFPSNSTKAEGDTRAVRERRPAPQFTPNSRGSCLSFEPVATEPAVGGAAFRDGGQSCADCCKLIFLCLSFRRRSRRGQAARRGDATGGLSP